MSLKFITKTKLPTKFGEFTLQAFTHNTQEHLVLSKGEFNQDDSVLVRVHSECLTGDGLFSLRCDCGAQLAHAMEKIGKLGQGMLIYLRQEGRGIGLLEKIKAYELQDNGEDTYSANLKLGHPADKRSYEMLGDVFKHFGIKKINLMTNNPDKIAAIQAQNIQISERIALKVGSNSHNKDYLQTKIEKFNHL
ncbi:MAG: GTP cyclohydrolase II [Proteobacteria bacterium]|nr:GTP cyclohydrolase II [Pseudomonadota bacterium]